MFVHAVRGDHLEVSKWVWNNGCHADWPTAILVASGNGHLEMLKWLIGKRWSWSNWHLPEAAEKGHLHIMEWSVQNGCGHIYLLNESYLDKVSKRIL